jgi:D-arginine dehydrogenase
MEPTLAYHTTGRSAAMFLETYGGPTIRALTLASRDHFERGPLLTPMPRLCVAAPGRGHVARELYAATRALIPSVQLLNPDDAVGIQPLLERDRVELAVLEPDAMEIDVHALHQSYVHAHRERGGAIATATRVASARPERDAWIVTDHAGKAWRANTVVNAAGAWADPLALLFGARPAGLKPLRRTAFIVDAPPGTKPPIVDDIDEAYYFKPDAGRLLCSPADETPQRPGDAKPDELEIARAIDAINTATTLDIRQVRSAWAGLRTFAADRTPVVGYDPDIPGLFWCAGQGGYGIQTAPALARTAAALVREDPLPADVAARGVTPAGLAKGRFE